MMAPGWQDMGVGHCIYDVQQVECGLGVGRVASAWANDIELDIGRGRMERDDVDSKLGDGAESTDGLCCFFDDRMSGR